MNHWNAHLIWYLLQWWVLINLMGCHSLVGHTERFIPSFVALLLPVCRVRCWPVFALCLIRKLPATTWFKWRFHLCPNNVFSITTLLNLVLQQLLKVVSDIQACFLHKFCEACWSSLSMISRIMFQVTVSEAFKMCESCPHTLCFKFPETQKLHTFRSGECDGPKQSVQPALNIFAVCAGAFSCWKYASLILNKKHIVQCSFSPWSDTNTNNVITRTRVHLFMKLTPCWPPTS